MGEWIRHRGSKSMPNRLEGMRFEVKMRDGEVREYTSDTYDIRAIYQWNHAGICTDIMAYRIISGIDAPDYTNGYPENTTAADIGAKIGDEFVVVKKDSVMVIGDIVSLHFDDGTTCPKFKRLKDGKLRYLFWSEVAPIPSKCAIELQEEVAIADQAQEWPEDRINVIGQNGNTGEHYNAEPLAVIENVTSSQSNDTYELQWSEHGMAQTNKYQRAIKGVTVDVYDVLVAFGVTCPAMAHAIKKMLMPGQRGSKDAEQDKREAIQAIERSIELMKGASDV